MVNKRQYKNNRGYRAGYDDGVADCADNIKDAQKKVDEAQEMMNKAWEYADKAVANADKAVANAEESINYCNKSQKLIDEVKIDLEEITAEQNYLRIENRLLGDKAVKAEKAEKEAQSAHNILVLNGVRGDSLNAVHDVMESHANEALCYREAIEANKTRIRVLGGQRQTLRLALADAHINGEL